MKKNKINKTRANKLAIKGLDNNIRIQFQRYVSNCARSQTPQFKYLKRGSIKGQRQYIVTKVNNRKVINQSSVYQTIKAPIKFCLYNKEATDKTLGFINNFYKLSVIENKRVCLDFSHVDRASAAAILLLHASIESSVIANSQSHIKLMRPNNRKIREIFQHMGIYKTLGFNDNVAIKDPSVEFWKHSEGFLFQGEKLSLFIEDVLMSAGIKITDKSGNQTYSDNYYVGLKEAIANCIEHAYNDPRFENRENAQELNKWWIFGGYKSEENSIVFIICDLGMGIPQSIQVSHPQKLKQLQEKVSKYFKNDSEFINASIQLSKSGTGNPERGKGLTELCGYVDDTKDGQLLIYSYEGKLTYSAGEKNPMLMSLKKRLYGTIIQWSIPLSSIET